MTAEYNEEERIQNLVDYFKDRNVIEVREVNGLIPDYSEDPTISVCRIEIGDDDEPDKECCTVKIPSMYIPKIAEQTVLAIHELYLMHNEGITCEDVKKQVDTVSGNELMKMISMAKLFTDGNLFDRPFFTRFLHFVSLFLGVPSGSAGDLFLTSPFLIGTISSIAYGALDQMDDEALISSAEDYLMRSIISQRQYIDGGKEEDPDDIYLIQKKQAENSEQ